MNTLTKDRVDQLFYYNKETGKFYWRFRHNNRIKAGDEAGSIKIYNGLPRCCIGIDRKSYFRYNLTYFYETGAFPPKGFELDHIDGNSIDDRFDNLRLATRMQNCANMRRRRTTRLKLPRGVQKNGKGFQAVIKINGVNHFLGTYKTAEEAAMVRNRFATDNLGEFNPSTTTKEVDNRTPREKVTLEDLFLLECLGEKAFDAHKKRMRKAAKKAKR